MSQQHPQQLASPQPQPQQPTPQRTMPVPQGQQTQQPQQMGRTLSQSLTQDQQHVLQQFSEAARVCDWCAEQCADLGQELATCLRLCRDVADIASLNARFISRNSQYGPDLIQLFITAATDCTQECSRHQHAHCQDCARVLGQAIQAAQSLVQSQSATQQPPVGQY